MQRREFLRAGAVSIAGGALAGGLWTPSSQGLIAGPRPPAFSIIPVVGDGKWIWTKPPENQTGYLEPREFQLRLGIRIEGTGDAQRIKATTTAPVAHPEQEIDDVQIQTQGCRAALRELRHGAGQLTMYAPRIAAGQVVSAVATYWLTISKQYHGYERDQFPYEQRPPNEVKRSYLQNSPGIQTRDKQVDELAEKLAGDVQHPWEKAQRFAEWVPENIKARIGPYTSVRAALENRVGDCEERSAVFVALCRCVGIPARLVWVPNHNWAEFYLQDEEGEGHWIPAHTSCYPWFGWVGAHELVLQKGDRVRVPERHRLFRLLEDWAQWSGKAPRVRWLAELVPLPDSKGEDPGPGQRTKDAKGEWILTGNHPLDKHMRR